LASKIEDVTRLSYGELNDALLECDDLALLNRWLSEVVASGVLYRALRVHGRLNAVRRAQEVAAIKKTCMAAQKVRKVA
jgi:hypothetical protein